MTCKFMYFAKSIFLLYVTEKNIWIIYEYYMKSVKKKLLFCGLVKKVLNLWIEKNLCMEKL